MTPEKLATLADEITQDPKGKGYAAHLPVSPGLVVELLNARTEFMVKSRMLTERGILASYGLGPQAGAAFMDKLDVIAASGDPGTAALKRMMKYLYGDSGVDIGDAATRGALDALVGVGGVTQTEADGIKAMALQPASRAEVLGLPVVTEHDLIESGVL